MAAGHPLTMMLLPTLLLALAPASAYSRPANTLDLLAADNSSLVWGPYRPNLYFGARPRIPKSVLMGLMWSRVEDDQTVVEGQ